jgi:outer membrane protein OmpA-like peptidoglycan-associated protein
MENEVNLMARYQVLSAMALPFLLSACMAPATNQNKPTYSDPKQARNAFADDLVVAQNHRVDVLAPQNFEKAQEQLKRAQEGREDGPIGGQVSNAVSQGEAYLQQANRLAHKAELLLPEVVKARDLALQAGARMCPVMLTSLDTKLKGYTSQVEDDIYVDRTGLRFLKSQYADLEKNSLRVSELDQAKQFLSQAEKKGIQSSNPKAYKAAVEKVNIASQMIGPDCQPQDTAGPSQEALIAAQNAFKVAKNASVRKKRVATKENRISAEIEASRKKEVDLNSKTASDSENSGLASDVAMSSTAAAPMDKEALPIPAIVGATATRPQDKLKVGLQQARSELGTNQADVILRGNSLIISLRNIDFSPGKSDLPPTSFDSLNKVKDVIDRVNGQKIVIEDHTGNAGTPQQNKILSQGRAEAVAQYFVSAKGVPAYKVEPIGYGDEKEAGGNKHLDIIIQAN